MGTVYFVAAMVFAASSLAIRLGGGDLDLSNTGLIVSAIYLVAGEVRSR